MIKLWEPVVRMIFYEINFALNHFKTCGVSMSDTAKQQFTANQRIYELLDKDRIWVNVKIRQILKEVKGKIWIK